MSPRTRAAAAIAAALITGTVLTPTPASATTVGSAYYDCGVYGPSSQINYARLATTELALATSMNPGYMATSITTTLDGVSPGPSGSASPNYLYLQGPFATLFSPPYVVRFDFLYGTTLLAVVTCTLTPGRNGGTWPV